MSGDLKLLIPNNRDTATLICKQGVTGSIPVTSTKPLLLSFPQLRLLSRPPILRGFARSNLEQQRPRIRLSVEELREISLDSTGPC